MIAVLVFFFLSTSCMVPAWWLILWTFYQHISATFPPALSWLHNQGSRSCCAGAWGWWSCRLVLTLHLHNDRLRCGCLLLDGWRPRGPRWIWKSTWGQNTNPLKGSKWENRFERPNWNGLIELLGWAPCVSMMSERTDDDPVTIHWWSTLHEESEADDEGSRLETPWMPEVQVRSSLSFHMLTFHWRFSKNKLQSVLNQKLVSSSQSCCIFNLQAIFFAFF